SRYDFDCGRANDVQSYGRTRGRFDVIGEVGKAKAVLGIELDMYYGQTGSADNNIQGNATSAGFGASGGFDLNTDSRTIFELKWLYTEFPLPIPLPTTDAFIGSRTSTRQVKTTLLAPLQPPLPRALSRSIAARPKGDSGASCWARRK